ncbi:MAG: putative signal transducing protein [Terriglobales bacterium]
MATAGQPEIPEPNEELVTVFDSEQESEVMVVRSLLESVGIETVTRNLDAPQDILPGVGGITLLVRAEQADEARQVISDYQATGPADAEAAETESEISGEEVL